jgi:predicted amidohydrolase YtcJ
MSAGDFLRDVRFLGPERAMKACPHRTLLDWEIPVAFGSDFPFEADYRPLEALEVVSRRPSPERIDPVDVLYGYTMGGAYAEGSEYQKGSLEPGKDADFVILNQNPLYIGVLPDKLELLATYHRGALVNTPVAV